MFKKDIWAREQLSRMALYEISAFDVAKELGCTKSYISQVFHNPDRDYGQRDGITREKIGFTISKLIAEKQKGG